MISFCTWIKNRNHQFVQVAPINLERMGKDDEWIIVDVGSTDNFSPPGDSRVRYYRIDSPEYLNFSVLYNHSHRLGKGSMLVNLDADNYIGPKFCEWVHDLEQSNKIGHAWSNDWNDGTYGRIVVPSEAYQKVGGYNEELIGCGFQDTDFLRRLAVAGYEFHTNNDPAVYGGSIPNPREDTMKYVEEKNFHKLNRHNYMLSYKIAPLISQSKPSEHSMPNADVWPKKIFARKLD